jgi:hypothetical protein
MEGTATATTPGGSGGFSSKPFISHRCRSSLCRSKTCAVKDDVCGCLQRSSATLAAVWNGGKGAVACIILPCGGMFSEEADSCTENWMRRCPDSLYEIGGVHTMVGGEGPGRSSSYTNSQSDRDFCQAATRRASGVGAVMSRSGAAWAAASIAMVWGRSSGRNEVVPGTQCIEMVVAGYVDRMAAVVSQIALHVAALSWRSMTWQWSAVRSVHRVRSSYASGRHHVYLDHDTTWGWQQ